jgi:hypothetical protein
MDGPLVISPAAPGEQTEPVAYIRDVKIELVDNSNRYGQVRSAELTVSGPILHGISWDISGKTYPDMPDHNMLFRTRGRLIDNDTLKVFFDGNSAREADQNGAMILLIRITEQIYGEGLLLRPAEGGVDKYVRLGICWIKNRPGEPLKVQGRMRVSII